MPIVVVGAGVKQPVFRTGITMLAKDILSPEQRSERMSRIRSKDTSPEMVLRKALWQRGHRYRLHCKLPGKPDLAFKSARLAIFVDGCFWHFCPLHGRTPWTNSLFWEKKFQENVNRDKRNTEQLELLGWKVLRFWEHDIDKQLDDVICKIEACLKSSSKAGQDKLNWINLP